MAYYGSPAAPAVDPAALGGMTPQEEFEMQMRILGEEQRRKQRLLGGDFRAGGVYPSFADDPGPINRPNPFPLTWGGRQISREEFQKFGGAAGFDPRAQAAAQQEARLAQDEAQWRRRQQEESVARAYTPTKRGVYSPGAPGQTTPARHQLEEYRGARVSDREAAKEQLKRGDVERLRPGIMRGVEIGLAPWQQLRDTPSGRFVDRKPHAQIVKDRAKPEGYDAQMTANRKRYYARQENRKQLRIAAAAERAKGIRRGGAWQAVRESYNNVPNEGFRERIAYSRGLEGDKQSRAHADKLAVKYGHKDWSAWAAAGGPTQAERNEIRVAIPVEGAMEAVKRWHSDPVVRAQNRERADYKRQPIKAGIGEQRGFKMPTLTQITEMAAKERPIGRWVPGKGFVGETKKDVFKRIHDRFDSRRQQLGVEVPGYGSKRKELSRLGDRWREANLNAKFLENVSESKTRRKGEWEAREAAREEVLAATPAEVIPGIHAEGEEPPLTEKAEAEFHTGGGDPLLGRPKTGAGLGAPLGLPPERPFSATNIRIKKMYEGAPVGGSENARMSHASNSQKFVRKTTRDSIDNGSRIPIEAIKRYPKAVWLAQDTWVKQMLNPKPSLYDPLISQKPQALRSKPKTRREMEDRKRRVEREKKRWAEMGAPYDPRGSEFSR